MNEEDVRSIIVGILDVNRRLHRVATQQILADRIAYLDRKIEEKRRAGGVS